MPRIRAHSQESAVSRTSSSHSSTVSTTVSQLLRQRGLGFADHRELECDGQGSIRRAWSPVCASSRPADAFGPCLAPEPSARPGSDDLGFGIEGNHSKVRRSTSWDCVRIRRCARGAQGGDEVVSASPRDQDEPNADMTLTINGVAGETQTIRFRPEGKSVPAFRWIRSANVAESDSATSDDESRYLRLSFEGWLRLVEHVHLRWCSPWSPDRAGQSTCETR